MAKIDSHQNFVIPIDGGYLAFIPQPSKYEVIAISKVLGYFYEQISKGSSVDVIVVDWLRIVDEALEDFANAENVRANTLSFLDKTMYSAFIKKPEGNIVAYPEANLDEEKQEYFKGTILFICALFRYASQEVRKTVLKGYTTSLTCEAWKKSFSTSSAGSKQVGKARELDSAQEESLPNEETVKTVTIS